MDVLETPFFTQDRNISKKDRSNLNIFTLEDPMMARLIKYCSEYFGDVESTVREHGENMISGLWERFRDARKGSVFFWWLKKLVRLGEGEEFDQYDLDNDNMKHPQNPHYDPQYKAPPSLEDSIKSRKSLEYTYIPDNRQQPGYGNVYPNGISSKRAQLIIKYLKQNYGKEIDLNLKVENTINNALDKANRDNNTFLNKPRDAFSPYDMPELGQIENNSVFRRSSTNILGMMQQGNKKNNHQNVPGGIDRGRYMKKKNSPNFFGQDQADGYGDQIQTRKMRDYDLQDKLISEIDNLLST